MNYLERLQQPERVRPTAALSAEDAMQAGMIDKPIQVEPIVDPSRAAIGDRASGQGRLAMTMVCPSVKASREDRLGWLKGSVQRGIAFLQAQPNYETVIGATQILQSLMVDDAEKGLSNAHHNHLKRQIREIIETMVANFKPETRYAENDGNSEELGALTDYLNEKLKTWWRGNTFPVAKLRDVLQHAVTGVGWLSPVWTNEIFGSNAAAPDLKVFAMEDVLIDQCTEDWDEQKAQAVTLYERVPTNRVRANWPEQAAWVLPSTLGLDEVGVKARGTEANNRVTGHISQSPVMALMTGTDGIGNPKNTAQARNVRTKMGYNGAFMTDLYFTYIQDTTLNTTDRVLTCDEITETDEAHMPTTTRTYAIPPIGVEVKIGAATEPRKYPTDRCRLYPTRRLIIWTPDHILYDGPSFYHHGQVPLVKVQLDPQVWNFSGGNMVEENRRLSSAFTQMLRGWVDALNARLSPPLEYDEKEVAPSTILGINLRKAGVWLKRKGMSMVKRAIEPILPYQHYEVADQVVPFLEFALNRMNHALGTEDFSSLARLQQLPDADGIEKIMAASGPLMSGYASNLERSITQLGYQLMWLWLQFDSTANRMATQSGMSLQLGELDTAPGTMIPGEIKVEDELTNSSFFYRLRSTVRKIGFSITPQSIFNVTDWKRKMLIYQLYREGRFPISSQTVAETFGLENFGTIPGATEYDKWINEQQARIPFEAALGGKAMQTQMVAQGVGQVQAQLAAAQLMQEVQAGVQQGSINPDDAIMIMQAMLEQGQQAGQSQQAPPDLAALNLLMTGMSGPGRPPTAQRAPDIEFKSNGDGTRRTTVTES